MCLVREIHNHMTSVLRDIGNIVLLRIVGHEPINQTQTDFGFTRDDRLDASQVVGVAVKSCESVKNQLIFALNVHI